MTKQEVSGVVFMLFAAFPQAEGKQTHERLRLYEQMLADLDFATAQQAVARLIQGSRFLPTIAEVRAAARELEHGPRRTGMEAWGDVGREVSRVGAYGLPRFQDELVARVVSSLSWRELCWGENQASLRARFCELYDTLSERATRELNMSPELRLEAHDGDGGRSSQTIPLRARNNPAGLQAGGHLDDPGRAVRGLPSRVGELLPSLRDPVVARGDRETRVGAPGPGTAAATAVARTRRPVG